MSLNRGEHHEWANQINCTSCNRITSSFACGESELSLICGEDGWRIEGWGLKGTGMPMVTEFMHIIKSLLSFLSKRWMLKRRKGGMSITST